MNNNHNYKINMIRAMMAISLLTSCKSKISFVPSLIQSPIIDQPIAASDKQDVLSDSFKVAESEQTITQDSLEKNISTVSFQIKKSDGTLLDTLSTSDISLVENSINIPNFTLTKNSIESKQIVDIAFAVDVTGSMSSTIESAKLRLSNFVKNSRALGYHTRMCLSTFGDYTVKYCDKFYDNDPSDASTEAQVNELLSEISKLKALVGAQDPGGADLNENPMRALIDAAKAPWVSNNQRFLILITDDGFLYSPNNQGAVGTVAPYYAEVRAAIAASKMKVFAVTPSKAGYNSAFNGYPGIVEQSSGQWFNFSDLIKGKITLDTVLNSIINTVNTTFVAQYTVDDVDGLDASLGLLKRNVEVKINSSSSVSGTIQSVLLKSNLPNGRESYKSEFSLTSKKINAASAKVYLNGALIKSGFVVSRNGTIKFNKAPAAGAVIKVVYSYEDLADSLQTRTIVINRTQNIDSIVVELNGVVADSSDYTINKTIEGKYTVSINASAYSPTDKYNVGSSGQLDVTVTVNYHD